MEFYESHRGKFKIFDGKNVKFKGLRCHSGSNFKRKKKTT